ncbi:tyrosyl-tRNA synthetase [Arthroderma uncinatum]|uniref:tyrosyl-tRNA synthetase n=1 Tax=Arthroderma uncinatum TaxID=74035 RepID=UPI00144AD4EC|nr:tyrosyl-tRNA synthetase [Arthroderma uncinatum]KAF3483849.1 tyrosyl-tRNA synthetase [Arthroderma uncinatum]
MASSLKAEEKYSLISRRLELQNGQSAQELQSLLIQGKTIKYQWVTAPTGKPHIGYFIPLIKFADFIRAGGEVIVEYIDVYAFLVNYKFPWEQVQHRTTYYRSIITAALEAVGVPASKVSMVQSSSYQGTHKFSVDFWKLCALCSQQDARDTGAEVGASTMLSPMLTPLLQELGEEYVSADVQFGGKDQRGIFNLGEQFLPELGYSKRVHLLNEMLPSLTGGKMSSSHPAYTKIMFLDDPKTVREKIAGACCTAGDVQGNGILPIVQHILMPISELRLFNIENANYVVHDGSNGLGDRQEDIHLPLSAKGAPDGTLFSVRVPDADYACNSYRHYKNYEDLEQDYVSLKIDPDALRESVVSGLNQVLKPIREIYEGNEEWRQSDIMGYPEDQPTTQNGNRGNT